MLSKLSAILHAFIFLNSPAPNLLAAIGASSLDNLTPPSILLNLPASCVSQLFFSPSASLAQMVRVAAKQQRGAYGPM